MTLATTLVCMFYIVNQIANSHESSLTATGVQLSWRIIYNCLTGFVYSIDILGMGNVFDLHII